METWDRRLPLGEAWARWVPVLCQVLSEIMMEIETFPLENEPIRSAHHHLLDACSLIAFTLQEGLLFEVSHPVGDKQDG